MYRDRKVTHVCAVCAVCANAFVSKISRLRTPLPSSMSSTTFLCDQEGELMAKFLCYSMGNLQWGKIV